MKSGKKLKSRTKASVGEGKDEEGNGDEKRKRRGYRYGIQK